MRHVRFRNVLLLVTFTLIAAIAAVVVLVPSSQQPAAETPAVPGWPQQPGKAVGGSIAAFAGKGEYAVFDADNTIWRNDLEEALLPYLEMRGVLTADRIDPSLKQMPLKEHESLYSYYNRLCEIDDKVCYPWIAQVFSGLSLGQLKGYVDELFAYGKPIPVTYYDGDKVVQGTVKPPSIYPGQRELIKSLQRNGIKVTIVSAASEELVRMVASDPKYGLDIPPQDVYGASLLLKDPKTGQLTTARKQISDGHFLDAAYPEQQHMSMVLTPQLWSPETWYQGKEAAIRDYIDPVRKPVLVAGDSPSDWAMLFYADTGRGGTRLWVDRKPEYTGKLATERKTMSAHQQSAGLAPTADNGWIVVTPTDLGG